MSLRSWLPALLVLTALVVLIGIRLPPRQSGPARPRAAPASRPEPAPPRPPGRAAPSPDPAWLSEAGEIMGSDAVERACGPYRLVTDVEDVAYAVICSRLATRVEREYQRRLGVSPVGEPRGAVLLFSRPEDFRTFLRARTSLAVGYSGFTRPARSIVALPLAPDPEGFSATLAHELAHLLHRRAFGPDLPPWLSEGLADALADGAGPEGLSPLADLVPLTALRRRLVIAKTEGSARPLGELLALRRPEYDRDPRLMDYEQSALLTRFLLLDRDLAPRFRHFLRTLAAGQSYEGRRLLESLEVTGDRLERRLQDWITEPPLLPSGV